MTRCRCSVFLLASFTTGVLAAPGFESSFLSPPAENRILKIIHSWPDEPAAQETLITTLSNAGFGGVVCNVSFQDYLRSDFKWRAFERAVNKAKAAGFALWLYDEKGYPSGTAGGQVLREHPEWEARGLLIADVEAEAHSIDLEIPPGQLKLAVALPVTGGKLDAKSSTNLSDRVTARKLTWTPPEGRWHVFTVTEDRLYEGTHASANLADHIPYPNLLDSEPTRRFLELTHDGYVRKLGSNLGRYFVATFTDEPSLMSLFLRPMPYRVLPWSTKFEETFRQQHRYGIADKLPALLADVGPETQKVRYDYWHTVAGMVSSNFFGEIQEWCHQHNLLSGGHLLMEENLVNQVPLYGDFFRCLRRLDSPGIDCLTSLPEQVPWYIARLAASAAALEGKTLTMCETSDHSQRYRPQGDTRPVRRVTEAEIRGTCNRLIVSGIETITSYYSFDGLDPEQLRRLNEYVGRCSLALKGSTQVSDIAVLYPVESVWTRFTPARHYANDSPMATSIENVLRDVSESLFSAGRDFTYIDGRALAEAGVEGGILTHGQLKWRLVILPSADTLPLKAWKNLAAFVASGGVVLSVGALPANSETEFPSASVRRLLHEVFGSPKQVPSVTTNSAGGAGIFLPSGLASLVPEIIDGCLARDFVARPHSRPLHYTHVRSDNSEVFFVINDGKEDWKGSISLCVQGKGEQWDPATGNQRSLGSGSDIPLELGAYSGTIFRFPKAGSPAKLPASSAALPTFVTRTLPIVEPALAEGEFVEASVAISQDTKPPAEASPTLPVWKAKASLKKSDTDTFLFVRFLYPSELDLRRARALVLESWVPEGQRTPTQLLVILHEKGGADYLAHSGRLLGAAGFEQNWIALDRFHLAGWSQDPNSRLDLDQLTEIRVGWGGYYGKQNETVTFSIAAPVAAEIESAQRSSGKTQAQSTVDLRSKFDQCGLTRRVQGARPTCSVFTVIGALEFAKAQAEGRGARLSVDYLNWAANTVCGEAQDGGFFSDLWKGFEKFGTCSEALMPYQPKFEAHRTPSPEIIENGKTLLPLKLTINWIKDWDVKTGLTDTQFEGVKQALKEGWPVCGGFRWPIREKWDQDVLQMCPPNAVRDGHSVLLVGYTDDVRQPGGGVFIFRNSGGSGRDGYMPYMFAREYMNDALWIAAPSVSTPARITP